MRKTPLRILVTNDDGIHAEGLAILERIARKLTRDVWVAAPESEQSGAGHSLTLHAPLRAREAGPQRFAISGTPTDAVLLATKVLMPRTKRIDLVLSGINRGQNVADDVTYSGTIAAAMEGTLLGIPSIALSQSIPEDGPASFAVAEAWAEKVIRQLLAAQPWPPQVLMNVNFPNIAPSKVKGVSVAHQGQRKIGDKIEKRFDPKKRPYYWIGGDRDTGGHPTGTDVATLNKGLVTVTPISLDLTDYVYLEHLRGELSNTLRSAALPLGATQAARLNGASRRVRSSKKGT